VFQSGGQLKQIYRDGSSELLSDIEGLVAVTHYAVSPDLERVAFSYRTDAGLYAIAVHDLDTGEVGLSEFQLVEEISGLGWGGPEYGSLFYFSDHDGDGTGDSIFLYAPGEPEPIQLLELKTDQRIIRFLLSSDGSQASVNIVEPAYSLVPDTAILIILDLAYKDSEPVLAYFESGEANGFQSRWSPFGNELLYQLERHDSPISPGIPDRFSAGPITLYQSDGQNRVLKEFEDNDARTFFWIDPEIIRITSRGLLEIIGVDGRTRISLSTAPGFERTSPDGRRINFQADDAVGDTVMQALEVKSLKLQTLGPGWLYFCCGGYATPISSWSADSEWLVWDFAHSPANPENGGEIYAYDFKLLELNLVSQSLAKPGSSSWNAYWLPKGHAVSYLESGANGYQYVMRDLDLDQTWFLGAMEHMTCTEQTAWHSNQELLWNPCDNGTYLTTLKSDGSAATTQLDERNLNRLELTENKEIAVMHPVDPEAGSANSRAASWQIYDFRLNRLLELAGTAGENCCGTLLQ
jgi:hypothetical protein